MPFTFVERALEALTNNEKVRNDPDLRELIHLGITERLGSDDNSVLSGRSSQITPIHQNYFTPQGWPQHNPQQLGFDTPPQQSGNFQGQQQWTGQQFAGTQGIAQTQMFSGQSSEQRSEHQSYDQYEQQGFASNGPPAQQQNHATSHAVYENRQQGGIPIMAGGGAKIIAAPQAQENHPSPPAQAPPHKPDDLMGATTGESEDQTGEAAPSDAASFRAGPDPNHEISERGGPTAKDRKNTTPAAQAHTSSSEARGSVADGGTATTRAEATPSPYPQSANRDVASDAANSSPGEPSGGENTLAGLTSADAHIAEFLELNQAQRRAAHQREHEAAGSARHERSSSSGSDNFPPPPPPNTDASPSSEPPRAPDTSPQGSEASSEASAGTALTLAQSGMGTTSGTAAKAPLRNRPAPAQYATIIKPARPSTSTATERAAAKKKRRASGPSCTGTLARTSEISGPDASYQDDRQRENDAAERAFRAGRTPWDASDEDSNSRTSEAASPHRHLPPKQQRGKAPLGEKTLAEQGRDMSCAQYKEAVSAAREELDEATLVMSRCAAFGKGPREQATAAARKAAEDLRILIECRGRPTQGEAKFFQNPTAERHAIEAENAMQAEKDLHSAAMKVVAGEARLHAAVANGARAPGKTAATGTAARRDPHAASNVWDQPPPAEKARLRFSKVPEQEKANAGLDRGSQIQQLLVKVQKGNARR